MMMTMKSNDDIEFTFLHALLNKKNMNKYNMIIL